MEKGGESDAMWPILPLTTALHLAHPYKGKEKRCSVAFTFQLFPLFLVLFSVSYSLPLYLSCFTA